MDRIDMALDDIIMHDRDEKKNKKTQNNKKPLGRKNQHQGTGGGAIGKQRISPKKSNQPYVRPVVTTNKKKAAEAIWTHDMYVKQNGGKSKGLLTGRLGGSATGARILGGPKTGLRTTHNPAVTTNKNVGRANNNRQQVQPPRQQQQAKVPQQIVAVPVQPPAHISIRGAAGPIVVVLSNLDVSTTSEDIKMVVKQCGAVQKVTLLYDGNGISTGTAEVVFTQREAAIKAVASYDNVMADGRLLRCYVKPGAGDIVPTPTWAQQTSTRPAYNATQPAMTPSVTGGMYSERMTEGNGVNRNARRASNSQYSAVY